jgi:hypothetical protein
MLKEKLSQSDQEKGLIKKDQVNKIHGLVVEMTQLQKAKNESEKKSDKLEARNNELG